MLTPWTNDVIYELNQMQRWSYDYTVDSSIITTQGVSTYPLPSTFTVIKKMFYIKPTGQPQEIEKRERHEAARILGDPVDPPNTPVQGAPRFYSLDNRVLTIFPIPNDAGFDAGNNYRIFIQGYSLMNPIIETTGSTLAGNATLTVPSTGFLTDMGAQSVGTGVSVRGAGNLGASSVADTFVSGWSAFPLATTVTMTGTAVTAVTNAQVYFNSQPWVVTWWPKVVLFALLREVASYLGSQEAYQLWETRYQNEIALLRAFEFDRSRSLTMAAAAHSGQNIPEERAIDLPIAFDVRGVL